MVNFISLSAIIYTLQYTNNDLRVVIYSFVIGILFKFLTVEVLLSLSKAKQKWVEKYLISPPPGENELLPFGSLGLSYHSSWDYFMSTLVFGLITFTFVNNADFSSDIVLLELKWGLIYAGVYWVKDLVSRSIEVDFKNDRNENLSYNSQSFQVLFAACVVGLVIYAFAWNIHRHLPIWFACGPFLVIKHGLDLAQDVRRFARRNSV
jgi:hypothetical protein